MAENNDSDSLHECESYVQIFTETTKAKAYSVYLVDSIDDQKYYTRLINKLRNAGEQDEFTFYLNNLGGYLSTGIQLIHAVLNTSATTTAIIDGPCHSLAPILALTCDRVLTQPFIRFMFHCEGGDVAEGKSCEVLGDVKSSLSLYKNILLGTCRPFLTGKEIDIIVKGSDLHLNEREIKRRLDKYKDRYGVSNES